MLTSCSFSVVVPTYNRGAQLTKCLQALGALRTPAGGFEIIVVNDGGADPPPAAIARAGAGSARDVVVLTQENRGPAAARNLGAAHARGEVLAFTDDDCLPDPGWLLAFDRLLRVQPTALLGGYTANALDDNVYSSASQRLVDFVARYFDGGTQGRFFTSNNMAVAREAFLACGGFDPAYSRAAGEDREFCDRWVAQGRSSAAASEAIVLHAHDLSLRTFVRQHVAYGRSARTFRKTRADQGRPVRTDLWFYARSISHAFRGARGLRTLTLPLLTLVAHASYLTGLVLEVPRSRIHAHVPDTGTLSESGR